MQDTGKPSAAGQAMDAFAMVTILRDILRLPEECLAVSFVYWNRLQKFQRHQKNSLQLDNHMLALACLSVASKAKDAPRRTREFLLPAWRLMHQGTSSAVLRCPSPTYDSLRSALVRTELILLRVLKFELRISTPFDFLPDYLGQAMRDFHVCDGEEDHIDNRGEDEKRADRVTGVMETGMAEDCKAKALGACKDYELSNYFPTKTVAAACIYTIFRDRGILVGTDKRAWLRNNFSRSIDVGDFEEAVARLDVK